MKSSISIVLTAFAFCAPMFGQADGITVTVSRNVDLPPDAVFFSMAVATDPDVSIEQVLQAAQALGITAQNLSGITLQQYGPSPTQARLVYAFDLSVRFSALKETNDKIAAARRTMAANTPPMELQVYNMSIAPADSGRDQARLRLLAPLMEDARARADQVAKAAGLTLGSVLGVTDTWANVSGIPFYGPIGPIGPTTLKTAYSLIVRYAVK